MNIALFGIGNMGLKHAKMWSVFPGVQLRVVVETNRQRRKVAKGFGVEFLLHDLTEAVEVEGKPGFPTRYRIRKDLVPSVVQECDVWDIAANSHSHFKLALLGLSLGKKVFLEKPPTETLPELQYLSRVFPYSELCVNYIELVHLVVKRAMVWLKGHSEVRIDWALHRRAKDLQNVIERGLGGERGSKVTLEHAGHDISELSLIGGGAPRVESVKTVSWRQLGQKFKDIAPDCDVRTNFILEFPSGLHAEIQEDYAAPEVRQFLWVDSNQKVGVYGNTLSREIISPTVAVVRGLQAIRNVENAIRESLILTQEDQNRVLQEVNAELLSLPTGGPDQLTVMAQSLLDGTPLCDIKTALTIQQVIHDVYHKIGNS